MSKLSVHLIRVISGHKCLKSREPGIKSAENICFSSKLSSVTYLDFLHARTIHGGTSNINVSGKIISIIFCKP